MACTVQNLHSSFLWPKKSIMGIECVTQTCTVLAISTQIPNYSRVPDAVDIHAKECRSKG